MSTQPSSGLPANGMAELARALLDEFVGRLAPGADGTALGELVALPSAENAPVPRPVRVKPRRKRQLPKFLSRAEVDAFMATFNLRATSGLRNRVMFELLYRAGLRVGEVCALEPRDVAWNDNGGTVRIVDGKGGDGTAYFDAEILVPLLERWTHERERLGFGRSPYLFCTIRNSTTVLGGHTPAGGPVSIRYLEATAKAKAKKAGIDPSKVTPHCFRHTYGTELLDEGLHIREVQKALRHARIGTTELYTHVLDSTLRAKIQGRSRPEATRKLCECGCGQPTGIAAWTDQRSGTVQGRPLRFVRGHNRRGVRYANGQESVSKGGEDGA